MTHSAKFWNLLDELRTTANQCWSLFPALWSFRVWSTLCRGKGGMFYLVFGYSKIGQKRSSVSSGLQQIVVISPWILPPLLLSPFLLPSFLFSYFALQVPLRRQIVGDDTEINTVVWIQQAPLWLTLNVFSKTPSRNLVPRIFLGFPFPHQTRKVPGNEFFYVGFPLTSELESWKKWIITWVCGDESWCGRISVVSSVSFFVLYPTHCTDILYYTGICWIKCYKVQTLDRFLYLGTGCCAIIQEENSLSYKIKNKKGDNSNLSVGGTAWKRI